MHDTGAYLTNYTASVVKSQILAKEALVQSVVGDVANGP